MAYIGKQPTVGNFVKLDSIVTSATTTFNLLNGGVAYYPQSANHCLVSLNGILQAPTDSFTISGSTIIFSSALTTSDVIDFIIVLGDVLNIGTPSDNTVSTAKLASGLVVPYGKGGTGLTTLGTASQVLRVNSGATALEFATPSAGSYVFLGETTASNVASVSLDGYFTSDYDIYKIFVDGLYGASNDVGVRITFNKSGTEETNSYAGSLFYQIATGSNTGSSSFDANLSHSYIFGAYSNDSNSYNGTSFDITLYNPLGTNNHKVLTFISNNNTGDLTRQIVAIGSGMHRVQSAISGIRFKMGSGNIYARKLKIYGVKNT